MISAKVVVLIQGDEKTLTNENTWVPWILGREKQHLFLMYIMYANASNITPIYTTLVCMWYEESPKSGS